MSFQVQRFAQQKKPLLVQQRFQCALVQFQRDIQRQAASLPAKAIQRSLLIGPIRKRQQTGEEFAHHINDAQDVILLEIHTSKKQG